MSTICIKYRLYPGGKQERQLDEMLEVCRRVYNAMLNDRNYQYDVTGKSPSRVDQINMLPGWRKQFPEIAAVHSQVLQNISFRVEGAFRAFFRRVKAGEKPGFPRFKGDGYDSFTYPQSGFSVGESTVSISLGGKQQKIKAKLHRPIVGRIKTLTIRRMAGKWFACFTCEYEPDPLPKSDLAIGIDAGLNSFLALSNGDFVANPRFFRRDEKALAKAQSKLSKQPKGSLKRRKAKKVVARVHERIRNRRHDFVHQTARRIVNQYGVIAVEKLNLKNMLGNHCLAKSISDASWSMFRSVLTQKAESAARELITVNPAYTSQDCHACGYRAKKKLSERWHSCPVCGASLDRDTNAALNILQNAMGQHSVAG